MPCKASGKQPSALMTETPSTGCFAAMQKWQCCHCNAAWERFFKTKDFVQCCLRRGRL
jgi:hypothetical protein